MSVWNAGVARDGQALTPAIAAAAKRLAEDHDHPRPTIPYLRREFGMSPVEATAAIRQADRIRRGHA